MMFNPTSPGSPEVTRRKIVFKYLALMAVLNLVWEVVQLPLYTLWRDGSPSAIAFAVVHCTLGDVLIGAFALVAALVLTGARAWPKERFWRTALMAGVMGVAYTAFSEWNNTVMTRAWSYSTLMPTLWSVGVSPIAQWIVIPGVIWRLLSQRRSS